MLVDNSTKMQEDLDNIRYDIDHYKKMAKLSKFNQKSRPLGRPPQEQKSPPKGKQAKKQEKIVQFNLDA